MPRRPDRSRLLHALRAAEGILDDLGAAGAESYGRCPCGLDRGECIRTASLTDRKEHP